MTGVLGFQVSSTIPVTFMSATKETFRRGSSVIRCAVNSPTKRYTIAVLPGDGVGNEVIPVAVDALRLVGSLEGLDFSFEELPIGGVALDFVGVPLPEETLTRAKQSDAVLLGAVGWPKWENNPKHLKPITALLQLCLALEVFANLRPITVLPQDTVNPMAAVLSAAMLLRYVLKEENAAKRIDEAVSDVLDRGFRTRDIHTPGTTLVGCKRMGEEILRSLDARV